jgi:diacylglycerol kinase family enzyme
MTREEVAHEVGELVRGAAERVRRHAREQCQHVDPAFVDAVCVALGDITIQEAIAALDRAEYDPLPPWPRVS